MGRAKPVILGTREFAKQGDAIEHFRKMLAKYPVGATVHGDDHADLLLLLDRHIDRDAKVGGGVDSFFVMIAPEGTKCFGVVRRDGSREDFSYMRCVTGRWA